MPQTQEPAPFGSVLWGGAPAALVGNSGQAPGGAKPNVEPGPGWGPLQAREPEGIGYPAVCARREGDMGQEKVASKCLSLNSICLF